MEKPELILASASPRRAFLLRRLGFPFCTEPTHIPELLPAGLPAQQAAAYLSHMKAVARTMSAKPGSLVLAADTVVILGNQLLGKPDSPEDAFTMLKMLAGKRHQVITAVTLSGEKLTETFQEETDVYFRSLSDELIRSYVATGLPMDKAGSYGIQECLEPGLRICSAAEREVMNHAGCPELAKECGESEVIYPLVKSLEGPFFNVMGLPLASLWKRLKHLGL